MRSISLRDFLDAQNLKSANNLVPAQGQLLPVVTATRVGAGFMSWGQICLLPFAAPRRINTLGRGIYIPYDAAVN